MDAMAVMKERLAAEMNKAYSVINDVTLEGSDGVQVLASKALLAERSNSLYELFYGTGRRFSNGIQINWYPVKIPSRVLRAVVEYCYTGSTNLWMFDADELLLNPEMLNPEMLNAYEVSDEMFTSLVQLLIVGDGWGIAPLYIDTWSVLEMKIRYNRGCICAFMEELLVRGCMGKVRKNAPDEYCSYTKLWRDCLELIEEDPPKCLLPKARCNKGVRGCSLRLLEAIFQGMGKSLSPKIAIKVLKEWNRSSREIMTTEERAKLQKLADGIDLNLLSLTELSYLEPCDLFSRQHISEARSVQYKVKKEYVLDFLDAHASEVNLLDLSQTDSNSAQKRRDKRERLNLAFDEHYRKLQKIGEE